MRLILDLQACQTASRQRGIGRYMDSLARAILAVCGPSADTMVALDGTYPDGGACIRSRMRDLLPASGFTRYHYPRPSMPEGDPADPCREIGSRLVARHLASLQPDAVLCGSMFEGYVEAAVTCEHLPDIPGSVAACVLYDLIPLRFPDQYLATTSQRAWYFSKLQALRNCDLLLAISDATRQDAIELLDFPSDRITTIYGAVDPEFGKLDNAPLRQEQALRRFGITRNYVLYTGNGDFRKNVAGAVEAFARLPQGLRQRYQLVLNQADRMQVLNELVPRHGLRADDVVVTGYVDDDALAMLLRGCDLFLFPSLYEGFGLPILEAMVCGAPVIGGDNSSIRELLRLPDARFDATNPEAIAACMQRALVDEGFRQTLRDHGDQQKRAFSWGRTAALALDALQQAHQRKQEAQCAPVKPRRRVAMFTPLSPERTGIANYSAELLPHLARHLDIDIYTTASVNDAAPFAGFRVRPWQEFESRAAAYDVIVYQVGNSPFHSHMFDLLTRYPGVVVLHDFFLSSAYWHMDHFGGRPGIFAAELAYSHGPNALRDLAEPGGDLVCRERYPCNLRVLEGGVGVIAHSPRIHELLALHGAARICTPVRVVRQLRMVSADVGSAERMAIRKRLGFAVDDWLVCSFGFVADTKLADRIVRAFSENKLASDRQVHIIFVGELEGGAYGAQLRELVAASEMVDRIHVTGFLDDAVYGDFLAIADVAVQLRTLSRGETSRAVLDCLAHGIPLIVNAHGTMNDYPESVLVRLPEDVQPDVLGHELARLHDDRDACHALAIKAREYIAKEHAPAKIAIGYAAAIEEMFQRREYCKPRGLVRDLAPLLARRADAPALIDRAASALSHNRVPRAVAKIFVDLSEVVRVDYRTGIHRVVRNLTRELMHHGAQSGYRCVPTCLDGTNYCVAADYVRDKLGEKYFTASPDVSFAPGDILLLLDSAWSEPERFDQVFADADAGGAEIVGYVYDLIPIRHPESCVPEMPAAFRRWLANIVLHSHAIVCISRATADDLVAAIAKLELPHRSGLRVHYAHLGSDLDGEMGGEASAAIRSTFADAERSTFLVVGTIEPRKGHIEVLDAFDQLWDGGQDVRLCLIGKPGWKMEQFAARLRSHPEFERRLHWQEDASDADLDFAYRNAAALIQASHAEGFGLPLLEAARHGTPLVCSDIAVFREVAGSDAWYFPVGSAEALAALLRRLLDNGQLLKRALVRERTWRDAAEDLMRVLGAHTAYRKLD